MKKYAVHNLIRHLLLGWLLAAALEFFQLPAQLCSLEGLTGIAQMNPLRMVLVTLALFVLLSLLRMCNAERWLLVGAFAALAAGALTASFTWAFAAVCLLVLLVLVVYALRGWNGKKPPKPVAAPEHKSYGWLVFAAALVFFLLVSIWTACRVFSFSTPTYDFGIFAQMFHSMRKTGLPITTVERDGALSHFAVHMSPIYYLLLPVYMLVPTPATLQVLQAAVLASAVIPLWKLGKHHRLTPLVRTLLCLTLLVYPAYAGGTSYDIHENAFLTPLILWLLYGIERKNVLLTAVFAALTLLVKEDAAVYVAVIALYLLLRALVGKRQRWDLITGAALLVGSLLYFVLVTGYLAESGDGVMTYRYKNFMYDGSASLVTVIKAVLLCPMKAIFECVDAEKLEFIALTLLPLAGLPLITRRYERYILLIPYILVNLMSDYQYQHDIFFQYTYGSTACLIYLTLVNLADIRLEVTRFIALGAALCIGAGCFGAQVLPKALRYPGYCAEYGAYYDDLRAVLDVVPEGASVAATTYYTTYLSQRDVLYDVRYASREHLLSCEYIALGVTDKNSYKAYDGYENFVELLEAEGYALEAEYEGRLAIYRKR